MIRWLIAFVIVGGSLVALVVSAPSQDAHVPDWMGKRVEAGRASLLQNLDLIKPGSALVLTGSHCRDDGAVRMLFSNRWLWLIERHYFADAKPGWSFGSMGGGVLSNTTEGLSAEDWLARHEEIECDVPPAVALPERCEGASYTIGYPSGWFVHPGDAALQIGPCSQFGSEPFGVEREDDFGLAGAQISIWSGQGCLGSFDRVLTQTELVIDGRSAFRSERERGEGGPEPRAVEIMVQLNSGIPCETSRWMVGRTESDDPGSFAENIALLDRMFESLELDVRE